MKKIEWVMFDNNIFLTEEERDFFEISNTISSLLIKIISKRIELKITQKELSIKSGVSQCMVSRIERGEQTPKLDTLIKLLRALDLEIEIKDKKGE